MRQCIKYIVITILALASTSNAKAQQDPLYTQYMFNTLAINPAYAGYTEVMSVMMLARQQWFGFEGAPKTGTFTAHSPIYSNMAAGASLIYDSYGPVDQTSFFADYAYHLKLTSSLKLSLGLSGGFNYYTVNYSNLKRTAFADNAYNYDLKNNLMPNFGCGLYLYSQNFYLGLSVPKIIENAYEEADGSTSTAKETRHYYGIAGAAVRANSWLVIKPSVLTRLTEGAPLNVDANLNFILMDKFWFGAMYRLEETFGGIVQCQLTPQIRVGYAFDTITNELNSHLSGSHEVMVSFEFNFNKEKVVNPRYF